jgi:mRNA interferase RelE/StbE
LADRPLDYRVLFHHEVLEDLRRIPRNMAARILRVSQGRLGSRPEAYGQRLRQSFRGFWKLRVGDYRVVYEITGCEIRVYGVGHRKTVYDDMMARLNRGWNPSRES